jgi:hypothetical protein
VLNPEICKAVSPAEDSILRYNAGQNPVHFLWSKEESTSRNYRLKISAEENMSQPVFDKIIEDASASFVYALYAGRWYWSVQPEYTGHIVGSYEAPVYTFTIAYNVPPPSVLAPANGIFVNSSSDAEPLYFSWHAEPTASLYRIVFSRNKDLSNPVITKTISDNFYIFDPYEYRQDTGIYYWAVRQELKSGESSEYSPVKYFVTSANGIKGKQELPASGVEMPLPVMLTAPADKSQINANDFEQDAIFASWTAGLQDIETSRFVLSRNENPISGGIVMDINNPPNNVKLDKLKAGTYYWQILAEAKNGTSINSQVNYFTVLPAPVKKPVQKQKPAPRAAPPAKKLDAPKILSPEDRIEFSGQQIEEDIKINFSWQAVSGADAYVFSLYEVSNDGKKDLLYKSEPQKDTALSFDGTVLGSGIYLWQMEAVTLSPDAKLKDFAYSENSITGYGNSAWSGFTIKNE